MARDLELALRVRADLEQAVRGMKRLEGRLGGTARDAGRAARAMRGMGAAAERARRGVFSLRGVLVGLGLAGAMRGIARATIRQEQAIAQVERGIRNLGEATELTTGDLRRMAAELQQVTTFGDEAILEMQSLLLTFREVGAAGPAEFRRITGTVLDMAVAMGMDAPSAARQLALALEDPERGLSQLRRSGTVFTDAQKDMIVAFVEAGERARAFGAILDVIEGQVGGAARTARGTLGGALDALGKGAWGDLLEVRDGTGELREEVERLVTLLKDPATVEGIQALGKALIAAFSGAADFVAGLGISISRLAGGGPLAEIADLLRVRRLDPGWDNRLRFGNFDSAEAGLVEFWSDEDIDRRLAEILAGYRAMGQRIPEAVAEGIRASGADIPAALLAAVSDGKGDAAGLPPLEAIAVRTPPRVWDVGMERLLREGQRASQLSLAPSRAEIETARRAAEETVERLRAAAEAHAEAVRDIEGREVDLGLVGEFEAAVAAAERWRAETLDGLDESAAGYDALAARAGAAYEAMAAEAARRQRLAQGDMLDGIRLGLEELGDESRTWAEETRDLTVDAFGAMEDALAHFVATGKADFAALAEAIVADLARIAIRQQITGPLYGWLSSWFAPTATARLPDQLGGIPAPGGIPTAHTGLGPFEPPRMHRVGAGLRPDEMPTVIRRDEAVLTPGQMRAIAGAGGPREVKVEIRNVGGPQRVTEARARVDLKRMVVGIVTEDAESGGPTRQVFARIAGGGTV